MAGDTEAGANELPTHILSDVLLGLVAQGRTVAEAVEIAHDGARKLIPINELDEYIAFLKEFRKTVG